MLQAGARIDAVAVLSPTPAPHPDKSHALRATWLIASTACFSPNTSKPAPEHPKYPYLLGGLSIERANQVWCSDVTYSAPRPGWSGVHIAGMLNRKEENEECLALCCEGA